MKNVLEYFGAVVIEPRDVAVDLTLLREGFVLNFHPTTLELKAIRDVLVADPKAKTFFSTKDITNLSTNEKFLKQVLHYFFVYGCGAVVDFPREEDGSKTVPVKLIRGITQDELNTLVQDIIYSNKPAKNTAQLVEIVKAYNVPVTFAHVANNELRIALYNPKTDVFTTGDDAVRYICKVCANSDLLIKSPMVIKGVTEGAGKLDSSFVRKHLTVLATVYNRHKRLLMALKLGARSVFKTDINHVARLSKTRHKALAPNPAKTVIADYKNGTLIDYTNLTVRDKCKLLNLCEFKMLGETTDVFIIRNGRLHVETGRKAYTPAELIDLQYFLLRSLATDLSHLKGKTIVFDQNIDYGLPVSRKQTVGNLPFGTVINASDAPLISAGVYWRNNWGATDIDLSTVDANGKSTGWGRYSGYDRNNPITFSGDVTNAPDGAMEFMTSADQQYGLFVNIYNGDVPSTIELVVGERTKAQWIDTPIIREKIALKAKQSILGFVDGKTFTVFTAQTGTKSKSGESDRIFLAKARSMKWTVKTLFDMLGISYGTTTATGVVDYDLRYSGFTIDKLEALLNIK